MLGRVEPQDSLCPQVTAKAVPKPQAKSYRFLSHHGTGAHRHDWVQPPELGSVKSHCCLLWASAVLSSPPTPLQADHHGPLSRVPPAWLGLVQVCFPQWVSAPRLKGAVIRSGSVQSRCLEELQMLCQELCGLWKLVRCGRACLSLLFNMFVCFPPEVCGSVSPPSFCELKKNWRKWFGR